MVEELFEVATEFRFDVGEAILNTNKLQGAVDGLDRTVNTALTNLQYLAGGLVAHLGLGAGGIIGVLTKAYKVSEDFNLATLGFSNNISTNMEFLTGTIDTFNERLTSSRDILGQIGKEAYDAGLSSGELGNVVQRIATPLASKGKLGHNYEGAIGMGKNLLMASSAVGLNSGVATESLARALTDRMALHGALFQRLVGTQAFRQAGVRTQGQLIGMDTGKKIDMLSKALAQLGGNADFINYRLGLMSTKFLQLYENINNFLKPIGDAIMIPLRKIFDGVNKWMHENGPRMGMAIGKVITDLFSDPEKFLVNLQQARHFKDDLKRAMDWTSIALLSTSVLGFFNKTKPLGLMIEGWLGIEAGGGFLAILSSDAGWLTKAIKMISSAFAEFLPNVAALTFFFQIFSRARIKAQINDAKAWATMAPDFLDVFVKMKDSIANIFLPLTMAIEVWSDWLAVLFETSVMGKILLYSLKGLAVILEFLGNLVVRILGVISGAMSSVIGSVFGASVHDDKSIGGVFKNIIADFKEGYNDFTTKNLSGQGKTPSPLTKIDNHNHIEARFDMREQLEPDRIAFSVTEHLKKLAISATQGPGSSLHGAFAGRVAGSR